MGKLNVSNMDFSDLYGQKFGKYTVLGPDSFKIGRNRYYFLICRCDCGVEKSVYYWNLKQGKVSSCGCLSKDPLRPKREDLTGRAFGDLTVIRYSGGSFWNCQCICGQLR